MKKRWIKPKAKKGQIKIQYGRDQDSGDLDLQFCYGGGGASPQDINMLIYHFYKMKDEVLGKTLIEELEARGYDITTLKMTIEKKVIPTQSDD